jgi:uncharacterized protein YyaL (SSP411 family)
MPGPTVPEEPLLAKGLAFMAGAEMIDGKATVYVCENFTCKLPTNDPNVLVESLLKK